MNRFFGIIAARLSKAIAPFKNIHGSFVPQCSSLLSTFIFRNVVIPVDFAAPYERPARRRGLWPRAHNPCNGQFNSAWRSKRADVVAVKRVLRHDVANDYRETLVPWRKTRQHRDLKICASVVETPDVITMHDDPKVVFRGEDTNRSNRADCNTTSLTLIMSKFLIDMC